MDPERSRPVGPGRPSPLHRTIRRASGGWPLPSPHATPRPQVQSTAAQQPNRILPSWARRSTRGRGGPTTGRSAAPVFGGPVGCACWRALGPSLFASPSAIPAISSEIEGSRLTGVRPTDQQQSDLHQGPANGCRRRLQKSQNERAPAAYRAKGVGAKREEPRLCDHPSGRPLGLSGSRSPIERELPVFQPPKNSCRLLSNLSRCA